MTPQKEGGDEEGEGEGRRRGKGGEGEVLIWIWNGCPFSLESFRVTFTANTRNDLLSWQF